MGSAAFSFNFAPYQMLKSMYKTAFYRHFHFSKHMTLDRIGSSNFLVSFKSLVNTKP